MFKKLGGITFWNILTAGINFVSSYFIVQWLGLNILGDFTIISSYVGLGTLIFAIIPPNFSVIRIQDDQSFEGTLALFFVLSGFVYVIYLLAVMMLGLVQIPFELLLFFAFPLAFQNYFDIVLQAENRLLFYFVFLFAVALLKMLCMLVFKFTGLLDGVNMLVLANALPQFIGILGLIIWKRKLFFSLNIWSVRAATQYIRDNLRQFTPYYANTFLKRVRENSTVMLFNIFVANDVIGLFALFTKIEQFVLGLVRNIEAFFVNKENIRDYKDTFNVHFLKLSLVVQAIYIVTGAVYMFTMTGSPYFFLIFIASWLVYTHIKYLLIRAELLVIYENSDANVSEILYLFMMLAGVLVCYGAGFKGFYAIVITTLLSRAVLQVYLIMKGSKKMKYDKYY